MEISIPRKLYDEIKDYCTINKIDNIDELLPRLLKKGFDLEKWGDINFILETPKPEEIIKPIEEIIIPPSIIPESTKPIFKTMPGIENHVLPGEERKDWSAGTDNVKVVKSNEDLIPKELNTHIIPPKSKKDEIFQKLKDAEIQNNTDIYDEE